MPERVSVLDTSVAAAWFFTDEEHHERALEVREDLRDQPRRYIVPHLFHAELAHVLGRKSGRDGVFVKEGLRLVLRLGIATVTLREEAVLRTAHWVERGLSGYDATFVALAEDFSGRWLTADEQAAKVAPKIATTLRSWRRASPA